MTVIFKFKPSLEYLRLRGEIYCITNLNTGQRYIGQTKCVHKINKKERYFGAYGRYQQHIREAKRGSKGCRKLYKALRGEDSFKVTILERCLLTELDNKEIEYIRHFHTRRKGYNASKGGKLTRRKILALQRRRGR